ncbi:MAG: cytochrome c oxidase assembly protein [Chloroflexota bacterium]|nr:MAG: cytochrome c oxidase assembly protein [Chloroflexota bacterium]
MKLWWQALQPLVPGLPHGAGHEDPGQWSWEPSIVVGTAVLVGAYLYGVGPLRRRYGWADRVDPWQVALFLLGNLILLLTLVSPLDVLSDDYLFSAHMVQHVLLVAIVPPLWLLGTPDWLLRPLLKPPFVLRLGRFLTHPYVAFIIFNLTFWLWHWPVLYDLALTSEPVHALQHLTFLITAVISWWPVLSPLPELPRLSPPMQVAYLFAICQPNVTLGALFVFSRGPLYQGYLDAPPLFGISPVMDQQIGGLIMWIPGNLIYLVALSIILLRWLHQSQPGRALG